MSEQQRPTVKLTDQDGNVFSLLAICTRALKDAGQADVAARLLDEVVNCGSYDDALQIMMRYVEVT